MYEAFRVRAGSGEVPHSKGYDVSSLYPDKKEIWSNGKADRTLETLVAPYKACINKVPLLTLISYYLWTSTDLKQPQYIARSIRKGNLWIGRTPLQT